MKLSDDDWRLIEDALRTYNPKCTGKYKDRDAQELRAAARDLSERIRTRDAR